MKLLLALFLISHSAFAFAVDVGNGSDGACNVAGGMDTQITSARKYYQCTTLDIDANLDAFKGGQAGAGGDPLVIKVQGIVTVVVGFSIDLSGENGTPGDAAAGKTGGAGGAGGKAGGSSVKGGDGANGSGDGFGVAGKFVTPFGVSSYGGGGGGGSYKTKDLVDQGVDGDDVGGIGNPGTGGANGNTFGSEAGFDTSFVGGSGGGAGGGGVDNGTTNSGGSGGGGGGAIRIIAGGDINVYGSIVSKGGNGGGALTTTYTGSGGGGSGGAIWLQSGGNISVTGVLGLDTRGGSRGLNDAGAGYGGVGGEGRIRLDDADGNISITGTVSTTPVTSVFTPTAIVSGNNSIRQYQSSVSCASVMLDEKEKPYNNLMNLVLGLAIIMLFQFVLASKKSKV